MSRVEDDMSIGRREGGRLGGGAAAANCANVGRSARYGVHPTSIKQETGRAALAVFNVNSLQSPRTREMLSQRA